MNRQKFKGSVYLNRGRYWWKVRLPGEQKAKAYPLSPVGSKFATQDRAVAEEVAGRLWEAAIFNAEKPTGKASTIAGLVRAYLAHARKYYRGADGKPTQEAENIRYGLAPLIKHCPTLPIEEFGPLKLKEVREQMIETGWTRGVVNRRIGIIKRMFRWAVSEALAPVHVHQALLTVEGLKKGRSKAREPAPITAVASSDVYAILPYTTPTIAAMVKLQLLSGMRSGELVIIRPMDIETGGKVWLYHPSTHKTAYRDQSRTICLGPQAQAIIKPFLLRKLDSYLFSPKESEQHRNYTHKAVGQRYTTSSYRKSVGYALKAAKTAGVDVKAFSPHRIRHTAATRIRKELGLDAARSVLGHKTLKMADDYAELDKGLAADAMGKLG